MKVPQREIKEFAQEIIERCEASRKKRMGFGQTWQAYYHTGSDDENPSPYNKIKAHVDRLASYLYSPVDVRFHVGYDKSKDENSRRMGDVAASILSNHFHNRGVDLTFGAGVKRGLIKGCALVKLIWGHNGIDATLETPECFAVYHEGIKDLSAQQAFVHTSFLTKPDFERILTGNPKREEILAEVEQQGAGSDSDDPAKLTFFKQLIIGGTQPVNTNPSSTPSPAGGIVRWMDGPGIELSPEVMADLVRMDEIWVIDDERQDYTTIQLANESTVVVGDIQFQNLCGIKGHQPFIKIAPNDVDGYFWGRSEIADVFLLQDKIKQRLFGISRMERKQEDPTYLGVGMTGITDETWRAKNIPGGLISESDPNAKLEPIAPEMPEKLWESIHEYERMFDEVTGTPPIMQGQGEQGVRSEIHGHLLMRTGSPRIRDRALIVERQLEDVGDMVLRFQQAHDATAYRYKEAE